MIDDKLIDIVIERLISRIEDTNTYILQEIGNSIKQIRDITPSKRQQLIQILKYGENYQDILNKLSKMTNLNLKDVEDIFKEVSKKDLNFAKNFYKYKNIPFVEYEQNEALKRQTEALSNIVKNEMYNFTRANLLGYTIRDINGRVQFIGLRETYNRVLDEALVNVGTGKENFDSAMTRIMKDIGGSGLKTIEYESGRSMRLDSAVRMHLKSRLRELHNENQKILGDEFGSDGVEISTHSHPAPDHLMQGHQFSNEEFEKLQSGQEATDYKGKKFTLDHDGNGNYRPISEMNCYHYIFSIILGVSQPEYNEEELQKILDENNKGAEIDGKHYTLYEISQLCRQFERKIREQKDIQILGKSSNNLELISDAQSKITILTRKYKEVCDISGLPYKAKRLAVVGYKRTSIKKLK